MNKQSKEYMDFGPWVVEIKDAGDVCEHFRHVEKELLAARLAFKVPVDMDKSMVREDSVLYDTAVALSGQGVTVYKLIDDAVYSSTIAFEDIDSLELKEKMLDCWMVIEGRTEKLRFHFNGASALMIERFKKMVEDAMALSLR